MTRRHFIGSSLVILIGAFATPIFASATQLVDILRELSHYPRKGINVKALNAAYTAHFGALDNNSSYFDQFLTADKSLEGFIENVENRVREDFKMGKIWTYQGWILSKTESEFTLRLGAI